MVRFRHRVQFAFASLALGFCCVATAQEPREQGDPYYPLQPSKVGTPRVEDAPAPPAVDETRLASAGSFMGESQQPDRTSGDEPPAPANLRAFEPGRVLARVGNHPIFVADLALEARQIIDQHIADAPETVKQQEMQKLIPKMLPKYIQAKVMFVDTVNNLPETAKLDDIMKSAEEQFDEHVLPKLIEKSKVESAAMLDAQYRAMGTSLRRTRQNWAENELAKYMVRNKLTLDEEISHQEIHDAWLAERETRWSVPARVRWERLAVRYDRFDSRQAAWDALAEMGNQVVFGASFAAVSRRDSHDPLADQGGDQGWTSKGSLADKDLESLLFSIPIGELSDIRDNGRGLEIVRVVERSDAGFIPFEEAQPEIRKQILDQRRDEAFRVYTEEIASRVPVEIFEPAEEKTLAR